MEVLKRHSQIVMVLAQKFCVIYSFFVSLTGYTHELLHEYVENTFFEDHFFHSYFDIFFLLYATSSFPLTLLYQHNIDWTRLLPWTGHVYRSIKFEFWDADDSITMSIPLSASGPRAKPISKTWNDISYHTVQRIEWILLHFKSHCAHEQAQYVLLLYDTT